MRYTYVVVHYQDNKTRVDLSEHISQKAAFDSYYEFILNKYAKSDLRIVYRGKNKNGHIFYEHTMSATIP